MKKLAQIGKSVFFGLVAAVLVLAVPASVYAVEYSNPTGVTVYTAPQGPGVCKIIVVWDEVGADAYMGYFDGTLVYGGARPTNPDGGQNFVIYGQGGVGFNFGVGQYHPMPSSVTLYSYYNSLWPANQGNYDTGVTLSIDQNCPNTVPAGTIDNPPVIGAISASNNPVTLNTAVTLTTSFSDLDTQDTHMAAWDWGDGDWTGGTVTESNGSGTVTGSHAYAMTGVFAVTLYLTDSGGAQTSQTFQYVSVYEAIPQGRFSAARMFDSPAGAYAANPSLTGKVKFGVSVKHDSLGQPTGHVNMDFKNGGIEFEANSLTTLVTSNGTATARGTGTINGTGNYTFLVTGISGQQGGAKTVRFQIKDATGNVVYDTQPGAPDTDAPTTAVSGQIIIQ